MYGVVGRVVEVQTPGRIPVLLLLIAITHLSILLLRYLQQATQDIPRA
jgi:hypothetical protein